MKYQIMIKMLMWLMARKKLTAREIAEKYEISIRSVYRYVEELNVAGVPVDVVRGKYGGIYIADTFRLPAGYFTRGEYAAIINALNVILQSMPDEDVLSAMEKLQRQQKHDRRELTVSGNVIVDGGSWADLGKFPEKMRICDQAARERESIEIDYISREGEHSKRVIDPYVLIFKSNVWYVYAFCHSRQDFRTFKVGRIRGARLTGRNFERKEITKDEIPLNFYYSTEQLIPVMLEIRKDAIADVEEWLGVDNVEPHGNALIASVSMPDDDMLVDKILSFGGKVKVIAPLTLKQKVKETALAIYNA